MCKNLSQHFAILQGVIVAIVISWLRFKGSKALFEQTEELETNSTIGRSPDNDFVLHDPDKYVSRFHATVYAVGENWFIKDNSSTSTVINNSVTLEKGQQFLLSEGDEITIGESVLLVSEIKTQKAAKPEPKPADTAYVKIDTLAPQKQEHEVVQTGRNFTPEPTEEVQEDTSLIFNIDDFFDDSSPTAVEDTNNDTSSAVKNGDLNRHISQAADVEPITKEQPQPTSTDHSQDTLALRAFLKEMEIEPNQLIGQNKVDVMATAGVLMRTLTECLMGVLAARSLMKEKLSLDQTQIQQEKNNAFKFSTSPEEALSKMLTKEPGYMDPVNAANEAVEDAKAHQLAMISGLNAAIQQTVESFDPKALEQEFEVGFSLSKKAKYWDMYCKAYETVAENAQSDSSNIFIEHFREHYELQIEKLKKK